MDTADIKKLAIKETALLTGLVFAGFVLLPVAIYMVGNSVFGEYGGTGYGAFFASISEKIRHGDFVAWFLIMSPYFAWQTVRLLILAWRTNGRQK